MKSKFFQNFIDKINGKLRYNNIINHFNDIKQSQEEILNIIKDIQTSISELKVHQNTSTDLIQSLKMTLEDINAIKNYLNITNIINFSSLRQDIIKKGFYSTEDWGTWLQDQAEITFKTLNTKEDISVDIYLNLFDPENEKRMNIFVNNKPILSISSLNFKNPVTLKIPKNIITQNNIVTINFTSFGAVTPQSVNGTLDTRKLAFGIIKIVSNTPIVTIPFDYDEDGFTKYYNCNFNNEVWKEYIQTNNTKKLIEDLKKGLENSYLIDLLYQRRINKFSFSEEEENIRREILLQDLSKYKILDKTGFQPEVFYFKNGLGCINENIVKKHLEKGCVIDGGACTGDSALMFAELDFVNKIYSFEPCKIQYENLKNTLELNNCTKAEAVKLGLSGENGQIDILGEVCDIITIDTFAKDKPVGCIKLDIEGLELDAIKGAIETIKRDTPLLLICLYHTPQDFFEIKPLLDDLNLGYKFKVVNTEPCNDYIGVHLVLIAYKDE